MTSPEEVIRQYVDATSAADEDRAAALTADDAVIELPDGGALKGKEGARQFAAKHAETDGRKQSVTVTSLEARTPNRFVATLLMSSREIATDELLYSMDVGGVIEVRDGLITRNQVFPSPEEATAAAKRTEVSRPSSDRE
jgi:ketosteroid isomerase-like protein